MPAKYDELGITLRRNSRVVEVDGKAQIGGFAHKEQTALRLPSGVRGRARLPA